MKNENRAAMTSEEKAELKLRIFETIKSYNNKRRVWMYSSIAASLALLAVCAYLLSRNSFRDAPQEYQIAASEGFENITDVVLQFSKDEQVLISEESSVIEYSKDDQTIKINDSKTVKEKDDRDKTLNTLIVPYGKRSEVILSDGTKVWLNSGSKLVYPRFFSGNIREVFLTGEAIFDVFENKEKPFFVATNDYVIKVLGTVFNVTNYPDDTYANTTLKSGLVQIDYGKKNVFGFKKSIQILPGTQATFDRGNNQLMTSKVNVDSYFSWKDGLLTFKNDPLEDIIKKVSRYYNVKVEINDKNLKAERFSGYLNLKDDIFQVIDIINESAGFVFSVEKGDDENVITLNKI